MVKIYRDVVSDSNMVTFKAIVLIMPAAIFSFVALASASLLRRARSSNVIPFIGTFASLFGFLTGGAGLVIVIFTFWKGLEVLERRVEGLSHQWGPSIYLIGVGIGCIIGAFGCFMVNLFSSSNKERRETFQLYDYDINRTDAGDSNLTTPKAYEATSHLNTLTKQDNYSDYYAVATPMTQNYPTYNQNYQQQQNYQEPVYQPQHQQQNYQEPAYQPQHQQQTHGNYY